MSALKLYFCTPKIDGSMSIKVFRDLAMLRSFWQESDSTEQVGVIHIGYLRPDIKATDSLQQYKGSILITASAKWSFPDGYVFSREHVCLLQTAKEHIPCYLVLRGFGYQLDEPIGIGFAPQITQRSEAGNTQTIVEAALLVLNQQKQPLSKEAIFGYIVEQGLYQFGAMKPVSALSVQLNRYCQGSQYTHASSTPLFGKTTNKCFFSLEAFSNQPEGWLADLFEKNQKIYQELSSFGIFNDDDYLVQVDKLPLALQDSAGVYRFNFLRSTIQENNIGALLDVLPHSLLHLDVEHVGFPVRVLNVLVRESISTLEELKVHSTDVILSWDNFGRKSLGDLITVIDGKVGTLLENPVASLGDVDMNDTSRNAYHLELIGQKPLVDHFTAAIASFSERDQEIIRSRTGFHGEIETLEEVGQRFGVTRERIRQIQKKRIEKIVSTEFWDDVIAVKIGQLLVDRKEPLLLEMLEIEDSWFIGFIENYTFLAGIIELFTDQQLRISNIANSRVISRINSDDWAEILRDFRKTLRDKALEGNYTRKDVDMLFISRLTELGARELVPLLWDAFNDSLFFEGEAEYDHLLSYGRSAEAAVRAVLLDAEKPLHYSEVAVRATEIFGGDIDDRRAQNALMHQGAKLYARGVYGLERFNPIPSKMCENICIITDRLIGSGPLMKQWHSSEIITELKGRYPNLPKELDEYILNIILSHSDELSYLKRMVWARRDSGQTVADRVDMADAFIKILEDNGAPLKGQELKEQLGGIRGVKENLQIQPTERLIQVGPDYWGLMDRDVGGSEPENEKKLNTLCLHLTQTQKGIHVTEVEKILLNYGIHSSEAPTSYALLNLAQRDDRFYLGRSMFLGLSDWGEDTRRLNFSQAVRKILNEMTGQLSTFEISLRVEELTGLEVDSPIAGVLIKEGATYDNETKKWSPS